jgi:DNA-binding LacI/PurR family transcriptional regulator
MDTFVEMDYLEGYKQAIQEAGLTFRSEYFTHVPMQIENARAKIGELLRMPDAPTAFLVGVRQTTLTVAQVVHDLRQNIAVLGEESPILQQLFPKLPRIVCSPVILGRQMARSLLQMLVDGKYPRKLKLLKCVIIDEEGKPFQE